MKEGTQIVDHLNVFSTLIFQLYSTEIMYEHEDKEFAIMCSLLESWDAIEYDIVMGDLLSEEMRRISSKKTSTT
jgi:hypothetical protein